jgi:DNA polymerase
MRKVGERYIIPMYHPAAALHQPALKPSILADFAKLPDQLNEARTGLGRKIVAPRKKEAAVPQSDKPQQLRMF